MLPDQFLFRAGYLFLSEAFACQFPDLFEQRRFHRLDFLRIGPELKCEQTGNESLHLAGTDVIRQSQLLANTNEKARPEVADRFVDQLEWVSIFGEHIDAAIADHDHDLRFFLMSFAN